MLYQKMLKILTCQRQLNQGWWLGIRLELSHVLLGQHVQGLLSSLQARG
jgi:hypothetical protein